MNRLVPWSALALALTAVLAVYQATAVELLRTAAAPGSFVAHIGSGGDAPLVTFAHGALLSPALRLVLARQAVEAGDLDAAAKRIAALPAGRDRSALAGDLAELRGRRNEAITNFLAAGDLAGLERESKAIEAAGDSHGAVILQRAIVDRLGADPTEVDDLAEAWWRLGYLEQNDGYHHYPIDSRRPWSLRSLAAYERAVALAPLSEKYLVSAGNEELNLNEIVQAERFFIRARDADPTSALPYVGLGEVAVKRGDHAAAMRFLERAMRIAPSAPAVLRLRAEAR